QGRARTQGRDRPGTGVCQGWRGCDPALRRIPRPRGPTGPGPKPHPQEGSRMPSEPRAARPFVWKSLAGTVLALAALAACTSGPPRPTTPTYSGATRPDPSRPPRPGDPIPSDPVSSRFAESRGAYAPRHLPRGEAQDIKRVAV